jgi:glycerol uptake facilitator-like aquaporin
VTAEFVGTGLLVSMVVGSGIAASRLSPGDVGLQLLENAAATAAGLAVLILVLAPVSGAHFNPVVSLVEWWQACRGGDGLSARELGAYVVAQVVGAVSGAVLANVMFAEPAVSLSTTDRAARHLLVSEVVATAGLVLLVTVLARTGRGSAAPAAVGAYIGSAYFFTSSTSFANPAVTAGRVVSDTFAGIAPGSAPGFVAAQLVGGVLGLALALFLVPARSTAELVQPHPVGDR